VFGCNASATSKMTSSSGGPPTKNKDKKANFIDLKE